MVKVKKEKHKYIFPNFLARAMSKVNIQVQYEASMMSASLILIGLILTLLYFILYFHPPLWYKIALIVNLIAGFIFLSSVLITTFHQYRTLMEALEFQREMKGGAEENAKNKKV